MGLDEKSEAEEQAEGFVQKWIDMRALMTKVVIVMVAVVVTLWAAAQVKEEQVAGLQSDVSEIGSKMDGLVRAVDDLPTKSYVDQRADRARADAVAAAQAHSDSRVDSLRQNLQETRETAAATETAVQANTKQVDKLMEKLDKHQGLLLEIRSAVERGHGR